MLDLIRIVAVAGVMAVCAAQCVAGEAAFSDPPADSTAVLQALLDAGNAIVLPAGKITNVSGLRIPPGGASIRGENATAVLHVTGNAAAILANGARVIVSDLTITGTAPNYTGYGTGPTDLGQHGIQLINSPGSQVRNVKLSNLSGSGIDYQAPSASFTAANASIFSDIFVSHVFRGVHVYNFGEYANFSNMQAKNNVVGMEVESGNVTFSSVSALYNSIGIKINGQANQNPCHGRFNGGSSNHNTYNLVVMSCGFGQVFNGMDFIGDQSGGLTRGAQHILIYNSRGISIANGQIGSNVVVSAKDPITGDSSLSGSNLLSNNFVRDDLTNFSPPSIGAGASLLKNGNYGAAGPVSWNTAPGG
ncbi:hypothetical protein [Bradyrhizobium sp. BR 10261]|uniref:hypothetical protein n=1 Tax=Bradyrhizobium sp. BR 10261 TaxID=2749992 RepID=UPI001C64C3D2|nr:hypothetical protein [Bradyrhizobium sp. BR 10261]MBW7967591.1 hypothetical protein [Bradyrhizobium sp. BR 10261]